MDVHTKMIEYSLSLQFIGEPGFDTHLTTKIMIMVSLSATHSAQIYVLEPIILNT